MTHVTTRKNLAFLRGTEKGGEDQPRDENGRFAGGGGGGSERASEPAETDRANAEAARHSLFGNDLREQAISGARGAREDRLAERQFVRALESGRRLPSRR